MVSWLIIFSLERVGFQRRGKNRDGRAGAQDSFWFLKGSVCYSLPGTKDGGGWGRTLRQSPAHDSGLEKNAHFSLGLQDLCGF